MEYIWFLLIAGYGVFSFKKRELAVLLMPLFFPLYLIRFKFFGIPFTLLEGFIYALAVPVFIGIFKDAFAGRFKYKSVYFFLDLLFIASVIAVIIVQKETLMIDGSTVYEGKRIALGILKGFVFAPMLYFVSFLRTVKSAEKKELALRAYLGSAVLLSLWAVYQALVGDYITPDLRASGPFESANYLALYVGPACAASFIYLWRSISKENGLIRYMALFAVLFLGLVFSHSYGALIGVFVALVFFIFYGLNRKWQIVFLAVILGIFGGFVALQTGTEKFSKLFEFTERSSSAVRLEVWEVSLNLIKENPVLGIGLGQFEPQYQLNAAEILGHAPFEWVMLHPHNLYLAFYLNAGLLGLIAFSGLLFLAFRSFRKSSNKMKVFGMVMLITILVHGFFDVPFWKNDLALIFWLTLGMLL
jgi:O-antigen ligase